jgi:hypothetical protein
MLLWVIRPPTDAALFTYFKLFYGNLQGVQVCFMQVIENIHFISIPLYSE